MKNEWAKGPTHFRLYLPVLTLLVIPMIACYSVHYVCPKRIGGYCSRRVHA